MATVSGMTAEAIKAILAEILVSAEVDEQGQIIFKTRGGNEINAGPVISPKVAIDKAYPVGSIYMNATNANPGTLLGVGTWVRFGNGRALVAVDEAQTEFNAPAKTGGAKTVKLSVDEMPSHTHTPGGPRDYFGTYGPVTSTEAVGEIPGTGQYILQSTSGGSAVLTTAATGGSQAHNNLQPYITVYMWRRTA